MPKRFPETCWPPDWEGAAAREHAGKVGDAFQALVRALVCAELPEQATAPGRGPDGGIDLHIRAGARASRLFTGPYPAIVQCKFHDPKYASRAADAWKATFADLKRKNQTGWKREIQDLWNDAKKYIYCVSVPLSEPARKKLEASIARDLPQLRRSGPKLAVQVVSWVELREWAHDGFAAVRDAFLGPGTPKVLPRDEYLARLLRRGADPNRRDFRRWLHPEQLPFAEPHPDAPYHPRKILRKLQEQMSRGGVILHGAGGVGKTRLAVEVGAIAEKDHRWRVLHVNANERGVPLLELLGEIAPSERETTLVIYDYVDQAIHFDPEEIEGTLDEYDHPNVVFLGTARQAPLTTDARAFVPIAVAPDDAQVDRVLEKIRSTMGADLAERFGTATLEDICGRRPIIALLILDELRGRLGDEGVPDPSRIREDVSVMEWLRTRLRDAARLTGGPAAPQPEHSELLKKRAVAAVFAAAPQTERELTAVARVTLTHTSDQYAHLAEPIVKRLVELGWLVPQRDELVVAHDILTDQMLEVVLVAFDDSIYSDVLDAVLSPALTSLRTLGRMSLSFGRLIGAELRSAAARSHLRVAVERWFERHAAEVKALLESATDEDGRDRTAYAIGALLASSAWSAPLLARWDEVVRPWLELQKTIPDMRHLLYRALRRAGTSSAMAVHLTRQAIDWFAANHTRADAGFFIVHLINRLELAAIEPLVPKLAEWLQLHAKTPDARFVIVPIVSRTELPSALREEAFGAAEQWLDAHAMDPAAFSVARTLLRGGLAQPAWPVLQRLCRAHHATVVDTDGADIQSLTVVLELAPNHDVTVAEWGERALMRSADDTEKAQLLAPSLRRPQLGALRDKFVEAAMALDLRDVAAADAARVWDALLRRGGLRDDERDAAIDRAIAWLQSGRREPEAGAVLESLLKLVDDSRIYEVLRLAVRWLPMNLERRETGRVLPALLARPELIPDRVRDVVSHALEWVHMHQRTPEAQFTIEAIVSREDDVDAMRRKRFARIAYDRFLQLGHDRQVSFVGTWLLRNLDLLTPWQEQRFPAIAVKWVETHPNDQEREFVTNALLMSRTVSNEEWLRAAAVALAILRRVPGHPAPKFLFDGLSRRHLLLTADERQYVKTRIFWAGARSHAPVQARFGRLRITEGVLRDALRAALPPPRALVVDATAELLELGAADLLRRHFRWLPPMLLALSHRVDDGALATTLVTAIRNAFVSDLAGESLRQFREHYHAAVALLPDPPQTDDAQPLREAALSDERHELRTALDAGGASEEVLSRAIAVAEEDLRSGAHAEAGRLLSRVLLPVADGGDAERIARVAHMCAKVQLASEEGAFEIFRRRCVKAMERRGRAEETKEILSLFALQRTGYVEMKLRRLLGAADGVLTRELAERALAEARRQIEGKDSAATFVLEALLILSIRQRDAALTTECGALVNDLFAILDRDAREKFRYSVYRGLEDEWPEYARRRSILESFGLVESPETLLNVLARHVKDGRVPPDDLLLYAYTSAAQLAESAELHGAAGKVLMHLLPLNARRNGGRLSPALRTFATHFLQSVSPEVRSNFARNVLTPLEDGVWPDIRTGVAELEAIGLQLPEENLLTDGMLRELAFAPERELDAAMLRSALALAESRLADGNVPGTGYLLTPLLPLAARHGDEELEARVHDCVGRMLWLGSKAARDGFRAALEKSIAAGAWPSIDCAEITLQKLGVSLRRITRLVAEGGAIPADELTAAIEGCLKMLYAGGPEDAAFALPAVLGAAFRFGDETTRYRARRLLDRFLDAPQTRFEEADAFVNRCRDMVAAGQWGADGMHLIEELGIAPLRLEELHGNAEARVDEQVLETGLRAATWLLEGRWTRRAEEFLTYLVPLSARVEDGQYAARAEQLVARMTIRNPSFPRRLKANGGIESAVAIHHS